MMQLPFYKMARAEYVVVTRVEERKLRWWARLLRLKPVRRLVTRCIKDRNNGNYEIFHDQRLPSMYEQFPNNWIISYTIDYVEGWDCKGQITFESMDECAATKALVASRLEESGSWEDIPDYGDLMTLDDWIDAVKQGAFIDYDGHGYYACDGGMLTGPEHQVYPSMVKEGKIMDTFTHIMWFNR